MDVHANDHTATIRHTPGTLGFDRLAQLLGGWQARELRTARTFPECRGLSLAQLEDLYQETAVALLSRPYASEEHLRNALRHGIRHRALNMHRDQRRRSQILAEHAPAMHRTAEASQTQPEDAALAQQDRLIAKEFLAELDPVERRVFALTAEGLRYRAIATALSIPANEARTAARSCERKRARFQLLYETGRICGYRAATIQALAQGAASGAIEQQAAAHLAACASCRAQRHQQAPEGDRGRGALAALASAALLPACRLVRRIAGSGGIAAKATAVAVTAAVVAGSTLGGPSHPTHSHERTKEHRGTPTLARPRAATRQAPRFVRVRGSRRPRPTVPSTAASETAIITTPPAIPPPANPGRAPADVSSAGAAEREFGPER
jgi:RNA polymerase sigma factor (sigma-70 family)